MPHTRPYLRYIDLPLDRKTPACAGCSQECPMTSAVCCCAAAALAVRRRCCRHKLGGAEGSAAERLLLPPQALFTPAGLRAWPAWCPPPRTTAGSPCRDIRECSKNTSVKQRSHSADAGTRRNDSQTRGLEVGIPRSRHTEPGIAGGPLCRCTGGPAAAALAGPARDISDGSHIPLTTHVMYSLRSARCLQFWCGNMRPAVHAKVRALPRAFRALTDNLLGKTTAKTKR